MPHHLKRCLILQYYCHSPISECLHSCLLETKQALDFTYLLQKIKCRSVRNKADIRTKYYRQKAAHSLRDYQNEKKEKELVHVHLKLKEHDLENQQIQTTCLKKKQTVLENRLKTLKGACEDFIFITRKEYSAITHFVSFIEQLYSVDNKIIQLFCEKYIRCALVEKIQQRFAYNELEQEMEKIQEKLDNAMTQMDETRKEIEATENTHLAQMNELNSSIDNYRNQWSDIKSKYIALQREAQKSIERVHTQLSIQKQHDSDMKILEEKIQHAVKRIENYQRAEVEWQLEMELLKQQKVSSAVNKRESKEIQQLRDTLSENERTLEGGYALVSVPVHSYARRPK
ncbi:hypothetical protein BDF14DRAFT_412952 [Spinellus fusiger]|nr:hypothetical protein BDF14DRAFT_412952 [Spinellus fusiger]